MLVYIGDLNEVLHQNTQSLLSIVKLNLMHNLCKKDTYLDNNKLERFSDSILSQK